MTKAQQLNAALIAKGDARAEAIANANANAHLDNAMLPTYSELVSALASIIAEAGQYSGLHAKLADCNGTADRISFIARNAIKPKA